MNPKTAVKIMLGLLIAVMLFHFSIILIIFNSIDKGKVHKRVYTFKIG